MSSGTVLRRYVPGPGTDEPVVWYEGSDMSNPRYLQADERGSIVAVSDGGGNVLGINTYDEFGIPGPSNLGRFGYTGQTWYPEVGLYNYKARWYSPTLGRFMQADPIGYGDGMNMYDYAHGDPVNGTDPSGLLCEDPSDSCEVTDDSGPAFDGITGNVTSLSSSGYDNSNDPFSLSATASYNDGPFEGENPAALGWGPWSDDGLVNYNNYGTPNFVSTLTASAQFPGTPQNIWSGIKNAICYLPALAGGAGMDAYDTVGGSVAGGGSFNPRNGQISIGFDTGIGLGFGGGARIISGTAFGAAKADGTPAPIASGGINANGTLVAGPLGGTASYQFLGSSPGDWSAAYTRGAEVSGNVNISGHGQFNFPALYNLGC